MKKSKVLIPAMALLLFSTAASITGTVAWFTSSRTFTMQAGEFVVDNVEGGMDVVVSGGVGTELDGTQNIKTKTGIQFTHGSFDHSTQTAWTLNKDATGDSTYHLSKNTLTNAKTTEENWCGVEQDSIHYYVAVSWKLTFTYEFHGETAPVGLYFNYGESTMTANATAQRAAAANHNEKTQYGFRIAFLPAGGNAKVWGNHDLGSSEHEYDELSYVSGEAKTAVTHYDATNYIAETSTYTAASDATASTQDSENKARIERLATLTKPANATSASIDVDCVAWFEGTDPNVISEAQMDKMTAKMSFYVRSDYVAPNP